MRRKNSEVAFLPVVTVASLLPSLSSQRRTTRIIADEDLNMNSDVEPFNLRNLHPPQKNKKPKTLLWKVFDGTRQNRHFRVAENQQHLLSPSPLSN